MPVENYPFFKKGQDSVRDYFERLFQERFVIFDGAMGTMIQKHRLTEEDFRVSIIAPLWQYEANLLLQKENMYTYEKALVAYFFLTHLFAFPK